MMCDLPRQDDDYDDSGGLGSEPRFDSGMFPSWTSDHTGVEEEDEELLSEGDDIDSLSGDSSLWKTERSDLLIEDFLGPDDIKLLYRRLGFDLVDDAPIDAADDDFFRENMDDLPTEESALDDDNNTCSS